MKLKTKAWKYATAFVVVLIILNPETINLALIIDSIGLEMFLMLFEIQVISIISALLGNRIKYASVYLWNFLDNHVDMTSWKRIIEEPECLIYAIPSQVTLMHALVILAVVGCCV